MRKQMSFRLNEEAIARLERLAEGSGLSHARVVERLLTGKLSWWDEPEKGDALPESPQWTAEEQAELSAEKRPARPINKLPPLVDDISSTKQVLRRKTNPMTGKPFGPVPK